MADKLRQTQPMKGRPATQVEIEAMGSICSLLGAPPPRTWKKWPNVHKAATEYLKESGYSNAP